MIFKTVWILYKVTAKGAKLWRNTEKTKIMVMAKRRFHEKEPFDFSGNEAEDCQSYC